LMANVLFENLPINALTIAKTRIARTTYAQYEWILCKILITVWFFTKVNNYK